VVRQLTCLNAEQNLCYVAVITRAFGRSGGGGGDQEKGGNQTIEPGKEVVSVAERCC